MLSTPQSSTHDIMIMTHEKLKVLAMPPFHKYSGLSDERRVTVVGTAELSLSSRVSNSASTLFILCCKSR